jgi:DNA-binding CsgD family transcriptional regulator
LSFSLTVSPPLDRCDASIGRQREEIVRELTDIGEQMTSLTGRDDELAMLESRIRAALSGDGSVLLLQGDAGIGKSSLLAAASEIAERAGLRVLSAAASWSDRERPFAVVRALVRCADDAPPGLVESTRPDPGAEVERASYAVQELVVDYLDELATGQPLLVIVDDLQWVDDPSYSVLSAWARRVRGRQALVVMAGRYPEPGGTYERLAVALVSNGAASIRVGPLDSAGVAALVQARFGAPPGSGVQEVLRRAGGNPFYVGALLDHLESTGKPTLVEGRVDATDPGMPPSLREAVLAAVTSSTSDSREILRLAGVLGRRFTLSDLAAVAGLDPMSAWSRLEPAVRAGLVDDHGDHLQFRHDLVREAVYADISGSLRAEIHRNVAEALANHGAEPAAVASHLIAGPRRPDPWAVGWLRRAAGSVSTLAPATASRFLERALELCPVGMRERDQLTADLVLNLVWSARIGEASRLADGLVRNDVDPETRATVLFALGWAYWIEGRTVEAVQVFRSGVEDEALAPVRRARLAAIAAWVSGFHLGQLEDARALAGRAFAFAEPDHDDTSTAFALAARASVTYFSGKPLAAVDEAEVVCRLADSSPAIELRQVGTDIFRTLTLIEADRIADADVAINNGTSTSRESGSASIAAIWHRTRALRLFATGDWDDALAELTALRALAEETHRTLGSTAGEAVRALIAIHRGDTDEADHALRRAAERETGPEYRAHWLDWARALRLEASGDRRAAFDVLRGVWSSCQNRGLLVDLPWIGPDLMRLAAGNDRHTVQTVASTLAALATSGPPSYRAAARRAAGCRDRDAAALIEAAELYRAGLRRYAEAEVLLDAAEIMADLGKTADASAILRQAVPLLQHLRATPKLDKAADLLARLGGSSAKTSRRSRPTEGWASLTPSETKVAELVAEGLSNPEIAAQLFISRRTVESHVARILTKMQLRSRTQVVKAVLDARMPDRAIATVPDATD